MLPVSVPDAYAPVSCRLRAQLSKSGQQPEADPGMGDGSSKEFKKKTNARPHRSHRWTERRPRCGSARRFHPDFIAFFLEHRITFKTWNAMTCNAMQMRCVLRHAMKCDAMQTLCNAVPRNAMPCTVMQCYTMPKQCCEIHRNVLSHALQCSAMQYTATPHNAVQCYSMP